MLVARFQNTLKRSSATLLLCLTIVACSDTEIGSRSFEESQSFTIPGFPLSLGPISISEFPVPINLAEQEAYSDGDFDFVTSVRVRDIVFEIAPSSNEAANDQLEDGNLDSFEFVSSMNLALSATIDGVEQTIQIADLPMSDPQIASNTTTLTLNVNGDQDIRDLIEAPTGATLLVGISGTNPPDFIDVDAKIRFRVGIGFR